MALARRKNMSAESEKGVIRGRVVHGSSKIPVRNAEVHADKKDYESRWTPTNTDGSFRIEELPEGEYKVGCTAFGISKTKSRIHVSGVKETDDVVLSIDLGMEIHLHIQEGDAFREVPSLNSGRRGVVRVESKVKAENLGDYEFVSEGTLVESSRGNEVTVTSMQPGSYPFTALIRGSKPGANSGLYAMTELGTQIEISEPEVNYVAGEVGVQLRRAQVDHTPDQVLWSAIRLHTRRIAFGPYQHFINRVLVGEERELPGELKQRLNELGKPMHGVGAYEVLRLATEAFLLMHCGVKLDPREGDQRFFDRYSESARLQERVTFRFVQEKLREYLGSPQQLPYITRVIEEAFPWDEERGDRHDSVLTSRRLNEPCLLELIWSYWHEEGMLAQTMNAVTRRFQNVRAPGGRDPLAHLEIDPLRPLNNILWGFIQDEFRRLTVKRRAYEYNHQYGLTLYGKAVSHMTPADSRSKFLEAFHNLLHLCSIFFKEDNDTTVIADGYPLLHASKEVHLLLAQGAQNQFGDLPWTARGNAVAAMDAGAAENPRLPPEPGHGPLYRSLDAAG
jgi:hypothetical protein